MIPGVPRACVALQQLHVHVLVQSVVHLVLLYVSSRYGTWYAEAQVVPIVGPILLAMGLDPIWLGIMIAINLQTSFLTPPFGFALFYLRGVAPESVPTSAIYRGVIPFIGLQLGMLIALAFFPELATWLPAQF